MMKRGNLPSLLLILLSFSINKINWLDGKEGVFWQVAAAEFVMRLVPADQAFESRLPPR